MQNLIKIFVGIIGAPVRVPFEKLWTHGVSIMTDAIIHRFGRFGGACVHTNYIPTHIYVQSMFSLEVLVMTPATHQSAFQIRNFGRFPKVTQPNQSIASWDTHSLHLKAGDFKDSLLKMLLSNLCFRNSMPAKCFTSRLNAIYWLQQFIDKEAKA